MLEEKEEVVEAEEEEEEEGAVLEEKEQVVEGAEEEAEEEEECPSCPRERGVGGAVVRAGSVAAQSRKRPPTRASGEPSNRGRPARCSLCARGGSGWCWSVD